MNLLTPADILDKAAYEAARPEMRRRIMLEKARRRVLVGDHASLLFESRDTMHYQVQEMLRAEDSWLRPGALEEELSAYNPLIPQRGELSATLMLEYETVAERAVALPRFVGLDQHVWLEIGGTARARASFDRGQIDAAGVSSVQYVTVRLSPEQVELLGQEGTVARVRIDHPAYQAHAVLGEDTRRAIAADCK
ncbi:MAG: DUF3501 family protein [Vicinamibacterales bacterium]|nr:DUF3501 family protein [Vicinamibacterales bacterium]